MRSGLAISGSAHSLLLIVIISNGFFLLTEKTNLAVENMEIFIISETEFDAEASAPPSVEMNHDLNNHKDLNSPKDIPLVFLNNNQVKEIEEHQLAKALDQEVVEAMPSNLLKKPNITDQKMHENSELEPVLSNLKTENLDEKFSLNYNKIGNEKQSSKTPVLEVPLKRNEDRIDRIASDNKISEIVSDTNSLQLSETTDKEIKSKDNNSDDSTKAATTEITPDGVKDIPIVVSGAILNSAVPPPRKPAKKFEEAKLATGVKEQLQTTINNLVEKANEQEENSASSSAIISTMEKLKLRKSINQLIGRYWNKGILIGGSDFENYVVKVEILLDSKGNIVGDIRPISPSVLIGRYAIAFREASNAIKAVGRIPLPAEKYKKGIKLKLTFDPASGIGFD